MKAVILAAGIGNRLKPLTDKMPKSLIKIGDRAVLERMLDSLTGLGITDVTIVVGHLKQMITGLVGKQYKTAACKYITNPDYELGSILSLYAARQEIAGNDVLLMDADVIFEREVLARLVNSRNANCFLADKSSKDTGEEMKVASLGGRVVQIARKVTREHDSAGEGVGFCKVSSRYSEELVKALEKKICLNRLCDYEMALDDFCLRASAGIEDVTGLRWTEIDFPEDIEKARIISGGLG
ncbi:MAG: phosphocholine cytidylyltransferase family protein [Candidatus Omnitrophota bacterium]|jgi:choline kinase